MSNSTIRDTISLDKDGNFDVRGESGEPIVITFAVENKYDKDILGNYVLYRFWIEHGRETYFKGLSGAGNQVVRNSHTQQLMETLDAKKKAPPEEGNYGEKSRIMIQLQLSRPMTLY